MVQHLLVSKYTSNPKDRFYLVKMNEWLGSMSRRRLTPLSSFRTLAFSSHLASVIEWHDTCLQLFPCEDLHLWLYLAPFFHLSSKSCKIWFNWQLLSILETSLVDLFVMPKPSLLKQLVWLGHFVFALICHNVRTRIFTYNFHRHHTWKGSSFLLAN